MKYILIICDGIGDLPIPELGDKTPLEAAQTPNLDRLAKNGKTGMISVLGPGIRPNSDEAHLTLFGYDLKTDYPGRGPIEAAGVGIVLDEGDVAIRGNLATVDEELRVLDRRAGRIEDSRELIKELDGMEIDGVKFIVKPGTGHRVALVMRGKGLSDKISNSDVHYVTENKVVEHWEGLPVNAIQPLDDSPEAKVTAEVLQKFLAKAQEILEANPLNSGREFKANYILTRGPGYYKKLRPFAQMWSLKNAACIAGAGLYKGLGVMAGMDLIEVPGATGLVNTDVTAKITAAKEKTKEYDFVFVHIKPPDIYGENGDYQGKKAFIEKIDQAIDHLDEVEASIAVTADHSTPCSCKDHSGDPVPLLIHRKGIEGDKLEKFGESECRRGSLGTIEGKDFMKLFLAT
jgi:2,3-bisphosphoglycerate-independent phosphoglycerate mutase